MRRALALFALAALALPALALGAERVSVKPPAGDVNTRFVYRGSGWKPNAKLIYTHGAPCGTGPCILPLFFHEFESDANGRFRQTERPTKFVPFDFEGYTVCFGYARKDGAPLPNGGCKATVPVSLAPPMASATPATTERGSNQPVTATLAAQHFKAGTKLAFHVRYPGGRHRVLRARARHHHAYVGPALAFVPRGGAIKFLNVRPSDPDGTYRVRVVGKAGGVVRTSFVVQHYHD